jgi:hypothetical protein
MVAAFALLLFVYGCSAEPNDAQLVGRQFDLFEYVLADSSHFGLPDLCVTLADPPNSAGTALAGASLAFGETTVQEHQVRRVHFGCDGSLSGDTVTINQQRGYSVDGSRVRIRRPRGDGGWYEDTGFVRQDTLDLTVHQCANAPCATVLWRYFQGP